ncbi:unnamed protein product [Gadus morhua 'NCC']
MQTRPGLTNYPRTRPSRARSNSHTMMLKLANLLLILYGLGQIPLAQGLIPRKTETTETTQTWNSQESGADSQSYPPLEPQEDLQTVGHQLHHSVRQGDPIRPQKPSGPAPLDDSQDLQTVGNQPHHSVRLGDPFRTQTRRCPATLELQEDLKTVGNQPPHSVRLRRDVVPLLWSSRKTSRPLATNRHTQSDYGTHFGLRRDVVPLIWSSRKTSRPLANNRTIQSD